MNYSPLSYLKNEDKYILFIYLFLFLTPLALLKSQVAIFSLILIIWGFIKYKGHILENMKILYSFKPLLLWISFVVFCFLAVLWSDSLYEGFTRVFNYHKYEILFGTALVVALDKKQAIVAIKILLLSFTAYSIFSIMIYFDLVHIAGSSSVNPKGILRFSISTQYMVIATFIAMFFAFESKNRIEQFLLVIMSFTSLFALFINNSRTSQLAFLLIFIIFSFIFSMKNIKFAIINILLSIIIFFSFIQNDRMMDKFNAAINEVQRINQSHIYSGSFGVRLYFNKAGLEILKDNFFFGMGPVDNRNKLVEMEKSDPQYKSTFTIKHFHSEHMEILTAYGFFGYMLIFSAVVLLIYKLRKNGIYFYISLSVFLTLFFVSFTNKTLALKPINYVYVIFFVLLSIIAYKSEQNDKNIIGN